MPSDPEYARVDLVLDLVNMGLLAGMSKTTPDFASVCDPVVEAVANVADWETLQRRVTVDLLRRADGLDVHSILRFVDGIRVVKLECGDPAVADEGDYYVLQNNDLKFVLESEREKWIAFLRLVDGVRTVESILEERGLEDGEIWKDLEEALEYGVLELAY